jgi:xanthine dehydrogenase YagS FAD-binding subunit
MQQDMIRPLEHVDARSVDHAISVLQEHGEDATIIAGNTDEMEWMKNRDRAPEVVVDIKPIDALSDMSERDDGGLDIGALLTVNEVASSTVVQDRFGVLAEAAEAVATPQIRNQGTIGGNVTQDSRCWYYRSGFDCYRAGGNTCYAITGEARDHAVTDFSRCITAHPSDGAVAFQALDAEVVVEGPRGERREPISEFWVGPEENITVMNDLSGREILKRIVVPGDWANADFYYEKVRDREAWDFPTVNIAAAVQTAGGTVRDVRLVANGVAPTPKRLRASENYIRGRSISEETAAAAGERSLPNAAPLPDNRFKVSLTANLVKRALTNAG